MHWVPGLEEHRVWMPKRFLKASSIFQYKFVVDGLWTCDGSLPMIEDNLGNMNNVFQMNGIDSIRVHHHETLGITRSGSHSGGFLRRKVHNNFRRLEKLPPPSVAVHGNI